MTNVLHGLLAATAFTVVGVLLLLGGFLLVDLLTPGPLRHQIWSERNGNAAVFLSSALIGIGAICFTSIITTYDDLLVGLFSTAVFGTLGLLLMAGAFLVVDALTPGRLGEILVDHDRHPAVWVSAATNLAVAAIVCASIS
jgi:uncharacterized membrane protein YjfL (UPF0719 family)